MTTCPEAVVWLIVPTVTVVLSSSTVGPALGNCVIASTALGIMPSLQAVPVVQGVVPDVGNQMDWAAATHGVMPTSRTNAHRMARPSNNTVMIPPPRNSETPGLTSTAENDNGSRRQAVSHKCATREVTPRCR